MSQSAKGSSESLTPPSIKRTNLRGWLGASAVAGSAACIGALFALWRPLPMLPGPIGSLSEHAGFWARIAAHQLSPILFREDARFYRIWWQSLDVSGRVAIEWRLCLAFMAACAPAALFAKGYLTPRDSLLILRGASRHEGRNAAKAFRRAFAAQAKRRPDHDLGPGAPFPADMWTRHVLIAGGTGSGKSTLIKPLIEKIVRADERLMLFDPKGEFTMGFEGPAILAPWDERSLAWDIARDMRNVLAMRQFAATMIEESSDPMWSNASRQLLVGLMVSLRRERGVDWGWGELASLISLPQAALLRIMKQHHPEAVRAVESASVTTQGVLINLASFCSPILDLAQAWGDTPPSRRVSFVRWALGKSRRRQIILQGHGAYSELTKRYVEGIVGTVAAIVNSVEMQDDPDRKLWFVADEFGQMGKIPVRALFEVGRSRGVRCVVACQDFAQLEEIHGREMVRALLAMTGTLLVGQISPGETAERLCDAFGSREVERPNVSMSSGSSPGSSRSFSFTREDVPLYKPSELASRLGPTRDGKGVKFLVFIAGNGYELFFPHYRIAHAREPHVPARWMAAFGKSKNLKPDAGSGEFSADSATADAASAAANASAAPSGGHGQSPLRSDSAIELGKLFPGGSRESRVDIEAQRHAKSRVDHVEGPTQKPPKIGLAVGERER